MQRRQLSYADQIQRIRARWPYARQGRGPIGETWDIGLRLSDGRILTMKLHLPMGFPHSAPRIQIVAAGQQVRHAYLDQQGFVTASPELNNWNAGLDISNTMQSLLEYFGRYPPTMTPAAGGPGGSQAGAGAASVATTASTGAGSTAGRSQATASVTGGPPAAAGGAAHGRGGASPEGHMQMLPVPSKFPRLDALPPERLQELERSEESRLAFLRQEDGVALYWSILNEASRANAETAQELVSNAGGRSVAEQVEAIETEIAVAVTELASSAAQLRGSQEQLATHRARFSTVGVIQALGTAVVESERRAKQLQAAFVAGTGAPAEGSADRRPWVQDRVRELLRTAEEAQQFRAKEQLVRAFGLEGAS